MLVGKLKAGQGFIPSHVVIILLLFMWFFLRSLLPFGYSWLILHTFLYFMSDDLSYFVFLWEFFGFPSCAFFLDIFTSESSRRWNNFYRGGHYMVCM